MLSKRCVALPLLRLSSNRAGSVCIFGAVCSASISSAAPPQCCLIASSNFSPHFPSSIAGVVFVALFFNNFVFTLLCQDKKLWRPPRV